MDGTDEAGLPRALKAALAAVAVGGLLAIVALGARGAHPGAHYHAIQRQVPSQVGDDLFTVLVIAYGLGLIVLIATFLTFRHKWVDPKSRWLRDLIVTLLVCGFVTLVGYRIVHSHGAFGFLHPRPQPIAKSGRRFTTSPTLPQLAAPKRSARFDWQFAAMLAGLAVVAAAFFLARGRKRAEPAEDVAVEEELEAAVDESIDDLRREADARRAVIAAYARMERVLRRHGRPRRRSEAPYEYLERVLPELRVRPAAVADLTELFERAKFSVHSIDGAMKTQAIDALVAVRDDLGRT